MAGRSKVPEDTMERVLHEFKEGELETGSGRKVTSRKQAVAIALSESGTSNQQSPAENKRRQRQSKQRESGGGATRAELYQEARKQAIPGRSRMNKADLEKAIG